MSVPRGKPRELVIALGDIQDLIGKAIAIANNDRNQNKQRDINETLTKAFDKCVESLSLYDPIN